MQRFFIVIYAFWRHLRNHFVKKRNVEKSMAIVFPGIFGDAVVILSSLQGYIDLYVKNGWKVTILVRPSIKKFWDEIADFPNEINIELVDYKQLLNSFSYYKSIVNKLDNTVELLVTPGTGPSAELLSMALNIKRKVGLLAAFKLKRPLILRLIKKRAYTEVVVPTPDLMMIQRYRLLLQYLGLKDYKGKLPRIRKQKRVVDGNYCVICPGSSVSMKRWPTERFAIIADYIIEKYNWNVHVCGGADEEQDCNNMITVSKYPNRIFNHVGKTSFKEWSAIVEYAQIVIGNDSATQHLAVAHGVKSMCIAGVFNKDKFFPYKVDELDAGDRLPESVYVDMPCKHCVPQGLNYGYKNRECIKRVQKGLCALCIEKVNVDMVKNKIELLLKEE